MKNRSKTRIIFIAGFVLAAVLPLVGYSANQQTVRVESSFVQVDATVTDKNGNRIRGLKSENFQVLEDNKPQKITAADYFDVHEHGTEDVANPTSISLDYANDTDTLREIGAGHRLIVFFFDRSTMNPEDISRSVNAARAFVKDEMTPADLITIAVYGTQLEVKSELTNNRETIDQTLESLIPGKSSNPKDTKNKMDDSVSAQNGIRDVETSLDAAKSLADLLGQIPGRKSVMHFTNGLLQRGIGNDAAVNAATGAANRNNVSFFEVDARALVTICGERPCAGPNDVMRQQAELADSRNTLSTLAKDTNGELFTDLNDFKPIFKSVMEESTGYYLLTYDPLNKKKDGTYRAVEIKLVNVPGGRITFRRGYYAPRE